MHSMTASGSAVALQACVSINIVGFFKEEECVL